MADVKVAENSNGDVAIGVEIEGAFIPFASVPKHRIGHQVERYNDLQEKVKAGDEAAQDVVDSDYVVGGPKKTTTKSEGGSS